MSDKPDVSTELVAVRCSELRGCWWHGQADFLQALADDRDRLQRELDDVRQQLAEALAKNG